MNDSQSGSEPHVPTIVTDGGPWATHDQACAVCHQRSAVLDLSDGIFQPCWECRREGWLLRYRPRRFWFRRGSR